METIIRGLVLGLSIAAPIGPANIEIIRRGLKEGWKAALLFTLGVMLALVIYLGLVILGLSFLTKEKLFNQILMFSGIIILFYLSYNALQDFFQKKEFDFSLQTNNSKHSFFHI